MLSRRFVLSVSVFATFAGVLSAQSIRNWQAPRSWPPPGNRFGALAIESDISGPLPFIPIAPCRMLDTRLTGGAIASGTTRTMTLTGSPCGIPSSAAAVSANFAVFNITGTSSSGVLLVYPAGSPSSSQAIVNWAPTSGQLDNASVVPLGAGGAISVQPNQGAGTIDLVIDVNGYYASSFQNAATTFTITTNNSASPGPAILAQNLSTVCHFDCGIEGTTASTTGGYGVSGRALGTTGANYGLFGRTNSTTSGTAGVFGLGAFANDTAGILGASGSRPPIASSYAPAAIRGECPNSCFGVLGITKGFVLSGTGVAVGGSLLGSNDTEIAYGVLATVINTVTYGVYAGGNLGASGTKSFVEPHPTDASKVIRYVSLEGPESGTYFRGRGKFQNGIAVIEVPEDFRMVSDAEGLSIQVTPIGDFANVAVVRIELDGVVVKASRNVEFFYTVNGVRRTHKDWKPIGPGGEFMPRNADAKMPGYLTEAQKAMLISNGTYKEDGTVNLETAKQLGWDRLWAERETPPQPR